MIAEPKLPAESKLPTEPLAGTGKAAEEERAELLERHREAREEAEILNEVSQSLAGEPDLQKVVQTAADAATKVTNAEFGAFFYNVLEKVLRENEKRFREMIDALPAAIYTTDAEGRLTHFNAAAVKLSGRTPQLGTDQWCVTWKLFHPDGTPMPHDACPMAITLKQGRSVTGAECIAERPDGSRFWFTAFPTCLHDDEGRVTGGINMLLDISDRKVTEEALRQSEERFRGVFNSSTVGLAVLSLDARFLQANNAFCSITGYSEQELQKLEYPQLAHPDDCAVVSKLIAQLLCGEIRTFSSEKRFVRKDGRTIWVQNSVSAMRDAQGRAEHLITLCEDVTTRKDAERASLHLSAIVDSSDDAIISKDLNGIVTSWNKSAERLFGYTAGEVIGQSITIIIPQERLSEEPDILRRLQRGERVDHFETIRRRKDGALLNISLTISPVKDKDGKIIGASKIARDITERKRAEAELLASESRFRQLADSMPQMVWTARADGYVDYFNNRWYEFTGFGRDKFGDASWQSILHPQDLARSYEEWYRCVRSGQPYQIEYRFWDRHEKRWRWFMGRALPVRDQNGKLVKWFGTCTDIDEQKRVEDELRHANDDLEQFAYSASHDLQEPLRGIKIYSELLSRRYGGTLEGQALEFLNYLRGNASRMEMLLRDLLAYTQITKQGDPDENTDANQALADALANLTGAIVESGARISSDPLPSLQMHRGHLKQVFQNLVGNAIKYRSPERAPAVHVSAEQRDEFWLVSVADNGIGIEPEYKERIFGLFKRLHSGDEYSGTGIGLAICQRIVDRYRGRIWVESTPEKGSIFKFTLPC